MLEVLGLFRIVFKSIREHYQAVQRRAGISGAQLWALARIDAAPGCQVGDLARELAVHQSTASNLLRRLEEGGFIVRKRVEADQRAVQLYTTARGGRVLRKAPRPLIGVLQSALSTLPQKDLDGLRRYLEHLVGVMKGRRSSGRRIPLSEM